MKPRLSTRRNAAMSLFEVGIVVAAVLILAVVFLSRTAKRYSPETVCANNLRQINLALKIWEGDNNDILPMGVMVTNGGAMELAVTGNAASTFQVMSNELWQPKIVVCPADTRDAAAQFTSLTATNISYFISADVTNDSNPQSLLVGDSHLQVNNLPAGPGLRSVWVDAPVEWSTARHGQNGIRAYSKGNVGLADGSVQTTTSNQLHNVFVDTGLATNWMAIP